MQEFITEPGEAGTRADVFVTSKYPAFTRSSLAALFKQQLIKIDGHPAKASQKIRIGNRVLVDEQLLNSEPPTIELPIIYEDDDVVVMDKPSEVLTHSKGALNPEGTVASFIKPRLNDSSLQGNRAGIAHRLDRATSGVIIAAKNNLALKHLQKQFSNRKTKKTYLAIVEGVPEPHEGIIDIPIARNPRHPKTFMASSLGKSAQTSYKVLKLIQKGDRDYALLELKPTTGRTHQLRVHLAYIKHPVVGDLLYGKESADGRLLLHAAELELTLPGGIRQTFKVTPPKDFKL